MEKDKKKPIHVIGLTTDVTMVAKMLGDPAFGFGEYLKSDRGIYYAANDENGNLTPETGLVLFATMETAHELETAALTAMQPIMDAAAAQLRQQQRKICLTNLLISVAIGATAE